MPRSLSGSDANTATEAEDGPPPDAVTAVADAAGIDLEPSIRTVNGVRLHTVAAGDPDDDLVVLLHGFPEFWYGWHRQIAPLVDAGFRILVPDQRGYNRSEKPAGVEPYRLSNLSSDVSALVESEDCESAHVVGHDWGGWVAWDLARRHPGRVDRLVVCNIPHYSVYRRTLLTNPRQLARSWYAALFQLPRLPDWLARRNDFALWADLLRKATRPGTVTNADLDRYRDAWRMDGAPTAMLNWYRAFLRHSSQPDREVVDAATLIIWGEQDGALVPSMAEASLDYCTDGRLETFPNAGHFVQHDRPEEVADLLVDHLGR